MGSIRGFSLSCVNSKYAFLAFERVFLKFWEVKIEQFIQQ